MRPSALLALRDPEAALDFDLAVMTRARQTALERIHEASAENIFGMIVGLLMENI